MKHIKKDGKYLCKVCQKTYSHPSDLKKHYRQGHTESELKKAGVETEKAIKYNRKTLRPEGPINNLQAEFEESKRDAFPALAPAILQRVLGY